MPDGKLRSFARFGYAVTAAYAALLIIYLSAGLLVGWNTHSIWMAISAIAGMVAFFWAAGFIWDLSDDWLARRADYIAMGVGAFFAVFFLVCVAIAIALFAAMAALAYAATYTVVAVVLVRR